MKGVQNFALIVFAFLIILLLSELPLWLVVSAPVLGLWKWWILRSGTGQPSRILLSAIGLMLLTFVLLDSAPLFSRDSMMAVVCISTMLFLLDRPHPRQVLMVHGGFYGMLISLLVIRAVPLPLFIYFFMTVLIFFSLMIHHLPPAALLSLWPLGRNILKISLPVSAILLPVYFFFPEIRPRTSDYAVSGLSDMLEPGRIAQLAQSDRVAFRVRFLQGKPGAQPLYWRSMVLEESFGMTWRKKRKIEMLDYTPRQAAGPLTYEMIPEVRLGLALPLLEHTIAVQSIGSTPRPGPAQIWWHPDLRVYQTQNELIEASAAPMDRFYVNRPLAQEELKIQISPRTRTVVNQLKARTPEQQVQFLLDWMREFTYTLKPGTLSREDALDDFLFVKKRGFCEHFAASFASLLQLAGTPARVVTGYEGGVQIGNSDFLLVRDSDAHAWVEVFWDHRWRRVDPTLVAKSEVPRESERAWVTALPAAWFAYGLRIVVIKLREWTQEFEYLWMALAALLAVIVPIQIYRLQRKRLNRPIWQTAMEAFLRDLEKRGIKRESHEGMRDFLRRVAQAYPRNAEDLEKLSQLYMDVLYGPEAERSAAERLLRNFQVLRRQINKSSASIHDEYLVPR
jgi:transglutaminase-like putative cysteine protease